MGETETAGEATPLSCASDDDLRIQSAILGHIVNDGHRDQTILEPSLKLSPHSLGGSVEWAVRELVGAGLLCIEGGKVVPDRAALPGHLVP
jgi:hypothetical protein